MLRNVCMPKKWKNKQQSSFLKMESKHSYIVIYIQNSREHGSKVTRDRSKLRLGEYQATLNNVRGSADQNFEMKEVITSRCDYKLPAGAESDRVQHTSEAGLIAAYNTK